jgi:hypothetical protein
VADAVAKTSTPDAAAGNPIDVTTVTTGAGTVDRQIVGLGDPSANNKATIKAGSTAVAAADSPLAVGLHPSSPLPTGANVIGALTANQSVNLAQYGGTGVTLGQKTMAASEPVVIASDQSVLGVIGDVDHDAVNTLKNIQVAGHASPVDVPPTAVSAAGDRVRAWMDRFGARIVRRRKIRESYTAVFRLAEAAARLDQTFTHVANTNKQWATLHHTAAATKEVRLQYCILYLTAFSAASQAIIELREINTAPATGNPAITPKPRRAGGGAAEAVALYLPTTAGTEVSVNSPVKSIIIDEGIMAGASTANPLPNEQITLYNSALEDDEMLPPTLPVGVLSGWAVMIRTVATPSIRLTCEMGFTEEIP